MQRCLETVNTLDVMESVISLEDGSGTLCQVTKFSNMENRWEELLTPIEVLPRAEY